MIARSTGLGKSKLLAEITDLKPEGDLLVLHLETFERKAGIFELPCK